MKPRIAFSETDAWDQVSILDRCINCRHMINRNLFGGICKSPEGGYPFKVEDDDTCECFYPRDKKVGYWIGKLVEMAMEYNGENDFIRMLAYHQEHGTDLKFISGL